MLRPNEAEAIIQSLVHPLNRTADTEVVDLQDAQGRILAQAISSHLDFPHWDNSAMDGYAVRAEDVQGASREHPVTLTIVDEIPAGQSPQRVIQPQQAARIFTGAIIPEGADTIVMQEDTEREGNCVRIYEAAKPHAFVRKKATFYQAGAPLLPAGTTLNGPEIAILAAAQCPKVTVYRRPVVAILSTGNELVGIDQPLQPGQIVDSNRYALAALIRASGAIPKVMGIIPDDPGALHEAIAQALTDADMILSSGGVSVGDYDYVDQILERLGATIHVRSVAVKPGKPLTVAALTNQGGASDTAQRPILYFGLPGNPVSTLVSFWRFVQPALSKLAGHPGTQYPVMVAGRSRQDLTAGGKRETYLWGTMSLVNGQFEFELARGSHSSGNLINVASTNALAVVPIGTTHIAAGQPVQMMLVNPPCYSSL